MVIERTSVYASWGRCFHSISNRMSTDLRGGLYGWHTSRDWRVARRAIGLERCGYEGLVGS